MTDRSPGPDADHIAELSREIAEQEDLAARCLTEHKYIFHGRAQFLRAELARLRNEQPKGGVTQDLELPIRSAVTKAGPAIDARYEGPHSRGEEHQRQVAEGLRAPSPAPSPEPQDVRVTDAMVEAAAKAISRVFHEEGYNPEYDSPSVWDEFLTAGRNAVEAALAQSDAQPVGWETRAEVAEGFLEEVGEVLGMTDRETNQQMLDRIVVVHNALSSTTDLLHRVLHSEGKPVAEIENRIKANGDLYTAPHRPDASGLIEEAEWLERRGNELGAPHQRGYAAAASALRTRAADRSALRSDRGGA